MGSSHFFWVQPLAYLLRGYPLPLVHSCDTQQPRGCPTNPSSNTVSSGSRCSTEDTEMQRNPL